MRDASIPEFNATTHNSYACTTFSLSLVMKFISHVIFPLFDIYHEYMIQ